MTTGVYVRITHQTKTAVEWISVFNERRHPKNQMAIFIEQGVERWLKEHPDEALRYDEYLARYKKEQAL